MRETLFVRSPNWKKYKLCLCFPYYYNTYNYIVAAYYGMTKPTSATDDNGTPATWTLVLSSSKPLTGRTGLQTEGRFSLLEPLETTLTGTSHYRTRTHRTSMTCLVGHTSIEATTTPATGTTRHHLATNLALVFYFFSTNK